MIGEDGLRTIAREPGRLRFLLLLGTLLLGAGCSSMTEQSVPVASLERLQDGNALIVVERRRERNASAHQVQVTDDGRTVGRLGVKGSGRLVWERPAGEMRLELLPETVVENSPDLLTPHRLAENSKPIIEQVEAGKTYRYRVRFKWIPYGLILERR